MSVHEEGRLSTTFLKPLQTQFYVPDDGRKCTPKRLIDFTVNPPLSDDADAREMRLVAENLICCMYCTVESQKRFFQLKVKTVFPLRACHVLLRFKYMSRESGWKELTFHSKLSVWSKCNVSVFWVRKDLIQHDATYRDRYQLLVDFDLVHGDWFPPENPYFVNKGTQVYREDASPKKMRSIPGTSEQARHPESNLVIEVEGRRLHTLADLLTAVSPVFAKMLRSASFIEGSERVVQLPGKSAAEVEELLRLLYPATPHRLSLQLAPAVLILANEYQIDHIKETAEDIIVEAFVAAGDPATAASSTATTASETCKAHHPQQPQQHRLCPMECYALARVYSCRRLERVCVCLLMDWSVEQIERHPVFKRMDKDDRCALAMGRMRLMELAVKQ